MDLKVRGYLNSEHNPDLYEESLTKKTHIYIKILDGNDLKKIRNVLKNYNKYSNPVSSAEDGLLIKIRIQSLLSCLSTDILEQNRINWFNKEYLVKFSVNKY